MHIWAVDAPSPYALLILCVYITYSGFVHFIYMYNVNFYSHHVQYGKTALHCASEHGRTEVIKCLLENTTAQVNAKDNVSH